MKEGGDNSNSSTEREDALKREPLLPIVCLPFWKKKKKSGWGMEGYRVGRYPRSFVPILDACASNLHIPPASPPSIPLLHPRIAYCLRTNGRFYARTDHVLDLLVMLSSSNHIHGLSRSDDVKTRMLC